MPIERVQEFSFTGSSVVEDKWWTAFQDENLNKLIDSAMQSNFDLATIFGGKSNGFQAGLKQMSVLRDYFPRAHKCSETSYLFSI
ncbi:hypothetical protein [Maribacter arcticus]|uniref:hypothetical protein n=1 Tax=Maribacter arcticus TaxID=561365 RepID=UPI0009A73BC9|nr:hypothetical protein [Maribacter arcticus]